MTLQKIYNDVDPTETQEWLEAFEAIVEREGIDRAKFILQALTGHAHRYGVQLSRLNTPYVNSIAPHEEPALPGDPYIERRIRSLIRWNALAMVVRANQAYGELGGHIASYASAGLDPKIMGMGPVPAARKALERAGWKAADLDLLEINEAFAAQACAVNQEMGWDTSKVNVNGGAIAIGHPIGASGCRILVTLLHEMQKRDAKKGIASLCIGGGMGVALTIER